MTSRDAGCGQWRQCLHSPEACAIIVSHQIKAQAAAAAATSSPFLPPSLDQPSVLMLHVYEILIADKPAAFSLHLQWLSRSGGQIAFRLVPVECEPWRSGLSSKRPALTTCTALSTLHLAASVPGRVFRQHSSRVLITRLCGSGQGGVLQLYPFWSALLLTWYLS